MEWKQLDAAEYSQFRTDRLRHKGGKIQRSFLESVRNEEGAGFVELVGRIPTHEGKNLQLLAIPLSEGEFVNPPFKTEERMYRLWNDLTPAEASSSAFWAQATIQHLKHQRIRPSYLVGRGGSEKGQERIERALESTDGDREKQVDDCVRTIFRQMGGLPEVRGNRSVFVDCPLARGWWRQRLVSRAARHKPVLSDKIVGSVVRESKGHWEKVVAAMVSRNPVFGLEDVQDAILVRLSLHDINAGESRLNKITSDKVQNLCQRFCFTGGSKELGVFDYDEILDMAMAIKLTPNPPIDNRLKSF